MLVFRLGPIQERMESLNSSKVVDAPPPQITQVPFHNLSGVEKKTDYFVTCQL